MQLPYLWVMALQFARALDYCGRSSSQRVKHSADTNNLRRAPDTQSWNILGHQSDCLGGNTHNRNIFYWSPGSNCGFQVFAYLG